MFHREPVPDNTKISHLRIEIKLGAGRRLGALPCSTLLEPMKTIAETYPDEAKEQSERGSFYGPSDYGPLLQSFGYKIAIQVDDKDYQGDSRLILRDGERVGLLIFGWGSCSGCDALRACETLEEIETLRTEIHGSIRWGTLAEISDYLETHDWEGDYSWHDDETKDFVTKAKVLLASWSNAQAVASRPDNDQTP